MASKPGCRIHQDTSHSILLSVQVNHGQGWGIAVTDGFVLNETVMRMMVFRLLLAATVIETFLDNQLGFEEDGVVLGVRPYQCSKSDLPLQAKQLVDLILVGFCRVEHL